VVDTHRVAACCMASVVGTRRVVVCYMVPVVPVDHTRVGHVVAFDHMVAIDHMLVGTQLAAAVDIWVESIADTHNEAAIAREQEGWFAVEHIVACTPAVEHIAGDSWC